jgi:hypothetical protein
MRAQIFKARTEEKIDLPLHLQKKLTELSEVNFKFLHVFFSYQPVSYSPRHSFQETGNVNILVSALYMDVKQVSDIKGGT